MEWGKDFVRVLRLGKWRSKQRSKLRHYKESDWGEGAHPGGWAAHLYCIGDETLIGKLDGESGAAVARMRRFGANQT
jgi:hypothetical protein